MHDENERSNYVEIMNNRYSNDVFEAQSVSGGKGTMYDVWQLWVERVDVKRGKKGVVGDNKWRGLRSCEKSSLLFCSSLHHF